MKTIDCATKKFPHAVAYVDDVDYERLAAFRWTATRRHGCLYAIRMVGGRSAPKRIAMHAAVLGSDGLIDHRDGNGLNNQRSNLRLATSTQNAQNIPLTLIELSRPL